MDRTELLTVVDSFQITGLGLVLAPDFSVPGNGWKSREEEVTIVTPAGQRFEALARLNLSHFNVPTSADPDRRWRVVVTLAEMPKDRIPVGSRIFVRLATRTALLETPNNSLERTRDG